MSPIPEGGAARSHVRVTQPPRPAVAARKVPEEHRRYIRDLVDRLGGARAVAAQIGTRPKSIYKWYQGYQWPSREAAEKLAALEVGTVAEALLP